MAKERALDVFDLLGRIDRKNYTIWDDLTAEQQKEFSPLVTMRWMAGTTDPLQLILLNEIVNSTVFTLGEHKELMLKLLAVCSNGSSKRYNWVGYKVSASKKQKMSIILLAEHLNCSYREAEDSARLFSEQDLIELAESHGFQKDDIKALKAEFKK